MLDNYEKSLPLRMIAFSSKHYLTLLALSIIILFSVSFHKAFPIILNPTVAKGEIVGSKVVGRYTFRSKFGGRTTTVLKAPIIEFEYEGKKFRIVGGSDEEYDPSHDTKVVFNRSAPQAAAEFSFEGLLDFPVLKVGFQLWLFLTAILYGIVNIDKHFSLFDFNVRKLTIKWVLIIAFPILLLPLIPHAKMLLFGARKDGIVTNEMLYGNDGGDHRVVLFDVNGQDYKIATGDFDYDEKEMIDHSVPVIYDITDPHNAALFTFHSLYFNGWLVATGMGLVFLSGWFFATRMPNDEGTMDEYH